MSDNTNSVTGGGKTSDDGNKKKDRTVNWWSLGVVTVVVLLELSCLIMFWKTCDSAPVHKDCDRRWMELRDSLYHNGEALDKMPGIPVAVRPDGHGVAAAADSVAATYIFSKKDIDKVMDAHKALMARQDMLADDLRQETNNNINKVNGWLAFWMGVMAILGVFVPIALQFKLYRESRDREDLYQRQFKDTKTDVEKCVGRADSSVRQLSSDFQSAIVRIETDLYKRLEKRVNDEIAALETMKLHFKVRTFHVLCDSPELEVVSSRGRILDESWREITDKFADLIDYFSSHKNNRDGSARIDREFVYTFSVALVYVASALTTIKRLSNRRRTRRVNMAVDRTNRLISIIDEPGMTHDELKRELREYCGFIRSITLR